MFKRWYNKTSESAGLSNRLILLLLAAVIAAPGSGGADAWAAPKQKSDPNDISAASKPAKLMSPREANMPAEPNIVTPDILELSSGATIMVKVVSVTLSKTRVMSGDAIQKVTLSRDGHAVVTASGGRLVSGTLSRIVVKSSVGMMAFDREDVDAVILGVSPPVAAEPLSKELLLAHNLLLYEAAVEKTKEADRKALAAYEKRHEKLLADAKTGIGSASQKYRLTSDVETRARENLAKLETRHQAITSKNRSDYSKLETMIERAGREHRKALQDRDNAAAELKDAEAAHLAVVRARTDEQRAMHRSSSEAIARMKTQAAKHEFVLRSGGDLSELAMQKAFDAIKIGEARNIN